MSSLRRTALAQMTLLLAVVGATAVIIAYGLARSEAAGFLDGQLRQIALNAGDGLPDTAGPPVQHDPEDDFVIEIRNAAGARLRVSPPGADTPRSAKVGFTTVSFGGEDWRVYTSSDGGRTVQVAQRMSVREELAARAAIEAAAPILAVIPLAWLILGWSLARLLDPLTDLARTIAGRGPGSKDPIPIRDVPSEVAPMVEAMNSLIVRLQHALDQQSRFVSDAAHALRTPLTALQFQVENLGTVGRSDDQAALVAALGRGIRRASMLVEQLLRMARFGEGAEPTHRRIVDLAALVTECVADHVSIASRKGVDLGIAAREPADVAGAPAEIAILVDNLIDNAVRYTPAGGSVDVSVRGKPGRAIVEVVDTGPGVPGDALPRLFDPFFRAAPHEAEGSGLGLAIVDAIAKRHGAVVDVGNRRDAQGFRVRVAFPRAGDAG